MDKINSTILSSTVLEVLNDIEAIYTKPIDTESTKTLSDLITKIGYEVARKYNMAFLADRDLLLHFLCHRIRSDFMRGVVAEMEDYVASV